MDYKKYFEKLIALNKKRKNEFPKDKIFSYSREKNYYTNMFQYEGGEYNFVISTQNSVKYGIDFIGLIVEIQSKNDYFQELEKSKDRIKNELGEDLVIKWLPKEESQNGFLWNIHAKLEVDIENESKWDEYIKWHIDTMIKFLKVFSKYTKNIIEIEEQHMEVNFNNKLYKKNGDVQTSVGNGLGRLCLDIFGFYLKQNPNKTYGELQTIFNSKDIHNSLSSNNSKKKVIFNENDFSNWYNDLTISDSKKNERYFGFGSYEFKDNDYNGEKLYFTTQWGNSEGNIDKMINFAKNQNYDIAVILKKIPLPEISKTKNIILYGAPGVGKTHNTNKLISLTQILQ